MAKNPADSLKSIPNLLSLSRIPLAIGLFACIAYQLWSFGLVVFCVAAITDWLDGWLARKLKLVSFVGRNLDPLTDKVLIGGTFIYLLPVKEAGLQPWMVTVVICRELFITGLRGIVESTGKTFGADWFGKLKTILQCATILWILVVQTLRAFEDVAELLTIFEWVQLGLLYAMLAATVGSGLQYLVKAAKLLK